MSNKGTVNRSGGPGGLQRGTTIEAASLQISRRHGKWRLSDETLDLVDVSPSHVTPISGGM